MGIVSGAAGGEELACTGCTGHRANRACCRRVRGPCADCGGVELPDRWHPQAAGEESSDVQTLLCAGVLHLYFIRTKCEHEICKSANLIADRLNMLFIHSFISARERYQCLTSKLAQSRVSVKSERSHPKAQSVDTVEVGEHGPTLGLDTEVVLGSVRHQYAVT